MENESNTIALLIVGPLILSGVLTAWWFIGGKFLEKSLLKAVASKGDIWPSIPRIYRKWNTTTIHIILWYTLLMIVGILLLARTSSGLFVPLIVIWVLLGFVLVSAFGEYTRRAKHRAITGLLDKLLEKGMAVELDRISEGLLEIDESRLRRFTMESMLSWGSPSAIGILREIRSGYHTTMPPIFYSSLRRLVFDLDHANPKDLGSMVRLTRHTRFWLTLSQAYDSGKDKASIDSLEKMAGGHKHLIGFYRRNQSMLDAFPNVFCVKTRRRAVLEDHGFMRVVMSPGAEENEDLIAGVKDVVGQIGGEIDGALEKGKLLLQLWNAVDKRVEPAEIDTLEVLGKADDWAVVAVLDKLGNYNEAHPFKILSEENSKLSENTLRILERHRS